MSASPDANFFTNEVSSSFRVVCDINVQSADPAADSWAGIAVRGIASLKGPAHEDCFSMLLRPSGGYQFLTVGYPSVRAA